MAFTLEHSLRCRKDFPALNKHGQNPPLAFLDGPGGSQVPRVVIEAIADFYETCNVNTHGKFLPSEEVDRRMAAARAILADFLGAEDLELHLFRSQHDHVELCPERRHCPNFEEGR